MSLENLPNEEFKELDLKSKELLNNLKMAEVRVTKLDLESIALNKKKPRQKRTSSIDKPQETKSSKTKSAGTRKASSKSRSNSRSSSRQRNPAKAAANTLGAKVYTKKELIQKEAEQLKLQQEQAKPAKRSLRSASSQSSTNSIGTPSEITAQLNSSINSKDLTNLNEQEYEQDIVMLSDLAAQSSGAVNRYEFRKRLSPIKADSVSKQILTSSRQSSRHSSVLMSHIDETANILDRDVYQSLAQEQQQQQEATQTANLGTRFNICQTFNRCFDSGYLRFTLKQLLQILVASILLVISLSIINYFNLFELSYLKDKLNLSNLINQVSDLVSKTRTSIAGWASSNLNAIKNLLKSFLSYF